MWIGGVSAPANRGIGRLAEGWSPRIPPDETLQQALEVISAAAREAGREAGSIGMEARVSWPTTDADGFSTEVEAWRQAGATHLTIDTMSTGQTTVDEHITALQRAADVIASVPQTDDH